MSRGSGIVERYKTAHAQGKNFLEYSSSSDRQGMLEEDILMQLIELAANRFEWKNLPDSIDPRFLEMTLFMRGLVVFFKDPEIGFLAMSGTTQGMLDAQNNPVEFNIYGNNYISRIVKREDSVPIWPNYMRMPELRTVGIYAQKLADLDFTIEVNNHNARRNKVIVAGENARMSAKAINASIDAGQPLFLNTDLGEMVSALDLGIDPKANEVLSVIRSRLFNECMSRLGINNSNQDKKERLVADEVSANDDQITIARRVNLNERQRAAEEINTMFSISPPITVDYYSNPVEKDAEDDDTEDDTKDAE